MSQDCDPVRNISSNNQTTASAKQKVTKTKTNSVQAPTVPHPIRILQKQKSDTPAVDKTNNNSSNRPSQEKGKSQLTTTLTSDKPSAITSDSTIGERGTEAVSASNKIVAGKKQKSSRKRAPKSSLTLGDLIPEQHDIWSTQKNQSSQTRNHQNTTESKNDSSKKPPFSTSNFPELKPTINNSHHGNKRKLTINSQQQGVEKNPSSDNPIKHNVKDNNSSINGKLPGNKNDGDTSTNEVKQQKSSLSKTEDNDKSKKIENFFTPKARESGSEDQLLRMYEEGKFTVQNKGRQRIRPRRKKFSTLKKKVLEERLQQWKISQIVSNQETINKQDDDGKVTDYPTNTVVIYGFCTPEELVDDDEYMEIVENLDDMAKRVGETKRVFVCRNYTSDDDGGQIVPVFVEFQSSDVAITAAQCWDGLRLGGQQLESRVIRLTEDINDSTSFVVQFESMNDNQWYTWCLTQVEKKCETESLQVQSISEVVLHQILTDDDLSDPECLEESMYDIKRMASEFGDISSCRIDGNSVVLHYSGEPTVAQKAVVALNSMVLGGTKVSASLTNSTTANKTIATANNETSFVVQLQNLLTEDDLADEECLQESLEDIRELAMQYGTVQEISTDEKECDDNKIETIVLLSYSSPDEATKSATGFHGMMIGGQRVTASLPQNANEATPSVEAPVEPQTDKPVDVTYSGDKIISDRFAECKRVPKIPNAGIPRKYATLIDDESVKPLLVEMLSELARLQQRAINDKNAKARRRLVMGLREVARGIRSHKVKLVVMANNLDEYGIIDDKLQEILDLTHEEDIPVFFELNKRNLGKALGKTIKIAVVGVQNTDGADQQFKKLVKLARTMPIRPAVAAMS